MSFTKTLTGIVASLYLGMGSAGAEEPKPQERQLSCSKEWNDLLSIVSTDGLINNSLAIENYKLGGEAYPVQQLKLQLSKDSSVVIEYETENCELGAIHVFKGNKKDALKKLTCFYINKNKLKNVSVDMIKGYCSNEGLLDLSNPQVRQAAERKFCGYVRQAVAKYKKDHRQAEENRVQEQLELLK